jgi:hypothetical protein
VNDDLPHRGPSPTRFEIMGTSLFLLSLPVGIWNACGAPLPYLAGSVFALSAWMMGFGTAEAVYDVRERSFAKPRPRPDDPPADLT